MIEAMKRSLTWFIILSVAAIVIAAILSFARGILLHTSSPAEHPNQDDIDLIDIQTLDEQTITSLSTACVQDAPHTPATCAVIKAATTGDLSGLEIILINNQTYAFVAEDLSGTTFFLTYDGQGTFSLSS